MNPSRDQLMTALRRADAAGDVAAAKAIARRLATPAQPSYRDPAGDTYSATEGQSFLENAAAGAGKSVFDTFEGVKQALGFGDQAKIDERARLDAPLMATGGGLTGNIAGQIGQMAIPGAALGKVGLLAKGASTAAKIGQAAAGAGAFAATQPVLTGQSRLQNTAVGALAGGAGQGVASGLARVAKGGKAALDPALRDLAMKAESYGIPVTAAQLTDSRFLRTLKSVVDKLPFSGTRKMADKQQSAFNRAVARTFGEDVDKVNKDVATRAITRLGGTFNDLAGRNKLKVDEKLLTDIAELSDEVGKFGTGDNAKAVGNLVDDLLSKTKGDTVDGKAYREFDSRVGKLIKGTSDGDRRHYLGRLRDSIREGMDRSVSPADAKKWKDARKQYRNLKTVEELIGKENVGDLSPQLLLSLVRRNDRKFAYTGGGELGDLAKIGQRFLKDPVPNSGTAERLLATGALGGGIAGGAAFGIDPSTMLGMALMGRGLGGALNSRTAQRYMLQGAPQLQRLGAPLPFLAPAIANAQE